MNESLSNPAPECRRRKRRLSAVCVIFALLIGVVWLLGGFEREPHYQGKSASEWLDAMEDLPDSRSAVLTAFKGMGSNAVPFLIKVLNRKPSATFQRLEKFAEEHDFPDWVGKRLPDLDKIQERRANAAMVIQELGPKAAAAIPVLMRALADCVEFDSFAFSVTEALRSMGEADMAVLPQLRQWITSTNEVVAIGSMNIIGSIGPKAGSAFPDLEKVALKMDSSTSLSAANALLKITSETRTPLRVFSTLAEKADLPCRLAALESLERLGIAAKTSAPLVAAMLQDSEQLVRDHAEKALRRLDPVLLQTALERMNQQSAENMPRFIEMIKSGSPRDQPRACIALALLGPAARMAVPELVKVLQTPLPRNIPVPADGLVFQDPRRWIAEALGEIGPEAASSVPTLVRVLQENSDSNAAFCCKALGKIGPAAKEAEPELEQLLRSDNAAMRLAAAEALARMEPHPDSNLVELLRKFKRDADMETRLRATTALWKLGLEPGPPVTPLVDEMAKPPLQWDSNQVIIERLIMGKPSSFWAVDLLGDIGPAAREAVPVLTKAYADSGFRRVAVAIALRKIDPDEAAKLGIPGLLVVP